MRFVKLTRPDGSVIWFGQGMVIRPSPPHAERHAQSEISYAGTTSFVCESPAEVVAAFEEET